VPRLLRPVFARRRAWLGELCRIAARLRADAYAATLPGRKPRSILFVQAFRDLVSFNPHVHVLAADGAFLPDGRFVTLPAVGLAVESTASNSTSTTGKKITVRTTTAAPTRGNGLRSAAAATRAHGVV
jgi:hypothetical protein